MNWVKLRLACNSEKLYHAVVGQVKADIEQMNSAGLPVHFETLEEGGALIVVAHGPITEGRGIVRIKRNTHTIHVTNDDKDIDDFLVNWSWNQDTASCDLSVNGEKLKLWEISQKALSPIFFPDDVDARPPVS